jgi:mono/diheme cytochrome c family protein
MKLWMSLLFVSLLVVSVAVFPSAGGNATKGKEVYTNHCAMCHGPSGEGKEAIGKMFKVTMAHLGSKEVQAKSDDVLRKDILDGNGKMKPVKLSAQDANDVIAYLRTLGKKS